MTTNPTFPSAGDELPYWYKNAIIYEAHVRAFSDSNGDGIGDFPGLTSKLDYLQDLGITALWLLPFYPSPLRDDGYDIADYMNVHPNYGTLRDVRTLLREAHKRGIRVITELVMNHTSDQHAWFQAARRAHPGSKEREFYVWSDTPTRYSGARIIFKDFEASNWTWDSMAGAYYWHRFYSHQPDLNFDNPDVQRAMFKAVDFWFSMGVDGLRLDAIPYLFEREGTTGENLPETHAFLKKLRKHVDDHHTDKMLLAEANQWPAEARAYFGEGDECHMAFHFPLMPRMFMSLYMEDRYPIIDILEQTPPIPENSQWSIFLRNHDELTLEMVTDEERDYMYRVYASDPQARINLGIRRRLVPLLGNNRRRVELMNGLMFSLPGSVVMYYGDEIGMGDNFYLGDRDGVRTPMQWSGDRNAGFSRGNPQRLYLPVITDAEYHYEATNVEAQQANPSSLLWWMKRLIALRKRYAAFGYGSIEFLHPDNRKVLAFIRSHQNERVLVVANLSRFAQGVELDMSAYKEMVPVELFGQTRFPPIGELPYFLTLAPHAFFWFSLEESMVETAATEQEPLLPPMLVRDTWQGIFRGRNHTALEARLMRYLRARRWFGGKARVIQSVHVQEMIPVGDDGDMALALVEVQYTQDTPETYQLPIAFRRDVVPEEMDRRTVISSLTVRAKGGDVAGVLYDPLLTAELPMTLVGAIRRRRRFIGSHGRVQGVPTPALAPLLRETEELEPTPSNAEQSNTSIIFGDRMILKVFRRPDVGINPELEIGRFLTAKARFAHTPKLLGAIEYRGSRREDQRTLAVLQEFVPGATDLWRHALDALTEYYERVMVLVSSGAPIAALPHSIFEVADASEPERAADLMGAFLGTVRLLGQRTAELHLALAYEADDPHFVPEPFTDFYRQGVYQTLRGEANRTLAMLRRRVSTLPQELQEPAQALLGRAADIREKFQGIRTEHIEALRTRYHGDYHLGQVLYTGKDVIILDFEGEVTRSLSDRRLKRSPLRDVAGMVRSFDYAAYTGRLVHTKIDPQHAAVLEPWADYWSTWTSYEFLTSYRQTMGDSPVLPSNEDHLRLLLEAFLLGKALYELDYELNNRPDWVAIPMNGILRLLG